VIPSLVLSGTTLDLAKRQAHAESLSLTGVKLLTWLESDGSFNWLKLAQDPTSISTLTPTPTAASAAPATAAAASPPWKVDLAGTDKVRAMIKALNGRPQLRIEVPIAPPSELDRPALVEAKFSTQLREAQADRAGGKKSTVAVTEYERLDPAAKTELLTQLYEKNFGGEPKFPQFVTSLKEKSEIAAAKADFLTQALHGRIAITDTDLTALGQQRAAAVQRALLTDTQVDPARVFLVANGKAKDQDGRIRLELSLQ
jgi:hypothetical protein